MAEGFGFLAVGRGVVHLCVSAGSGITVPGKLWFGVERGGQNVYLVEREPWIAWDGEVAVESYVLNFFLRISAGRCQQSPIHDFCPIDYKSSAA